ncbi:MAG: hypothetical protein R2752_16025 [Vicinamibacterales bacterium]
MLGGGLGGFHPLDGSPLVIRATLNDWIRFRRPGRYILTVSSSRLHRYTRGFPSQMLVAAPLMLEIVPASTDWAAGEVSRALRLLAAGTEAERLTGAAILRYLGTPAAAQALLDHFADLSDTGLGFEVVAGLIAAPDREFVVNRMRDQVASGALVPDRYLYVLSRLEALLAPSAGSTARERMEAWTAGLDVMRAQWASAVVRQPPTPERFVSLMGVLHDARLEPMILAALQAEPAIAETAFRRLRPDAQRRLIEQHWESLDSPWARRAIRGLYEDASRATPDPTGSRVVDVVLTRLLALEPAEGRRLILEEIATGTRGVSYEVLASLPDGRRPDLDRALVKRFLAAPTDGSTGEREQSAWLLARYASGDVLPVVRRTLESGRVDCGVEAGLLAYLLDFDPAAAMARLDPRFDRAGGCMGPPFRALAQHRWDPGVESMVILHLRGLDDGAVAEAAGVLGSYGSVTAKAELFARFEVWHTEWVGREGDLDGQAPWAVEGRRRIESALLNALLEGGRRWGFSQADATRLLALCVTDACRDQARMTGGRGGGHPGSGWTVLGPG